MAKKSLVVFLDKGIIGTFVGFEQHGGEDDFIYLTYVPLDTFPAKKVRYPKPIPRSAVHVVDPILNIPGVVDQLRFIYTGEEDSIIKGILEEDLKKDNDRLREKIKSVEMKNASLLQEVEDARAGIKKSIATQRSLTRSNESRLFDGLPGRQGFDEDVGSGGDGFD